MIDEQFRLCIVSEWMEHKDMRIYLEKNKDANRVELVNLRPRSLEPISDSLGYSYLG